MVEVSANPTPFLGCSTFPVLLHTVPASIILSCHPLLVSQPPSGELSSVDDLSKWGLGDGWISLWSPGILGFSIQSPGLQSWPPSWFSLMASPSGLFTPSDATKLGISSNTQSGKSSAQNCLSLRLCNLLFVSFLYRKKCRMEKGQRKNF